MESMFGSRRTSKKETRKSRMEGGGDSKKRFQYCTDDSGTIVYFRALQGHSGRNLIDPSLQDNVIIPSYFFQYIYHVEMREVTRILMRLT